MAETWNKKEREKKRQQGKKEKAAKKAERKENSADGNNLDSMMAYLDEYGNITDQPMDPKRKIVNNVEDMVIGATKHEPEAARDPIRKGTVTFFNGAKGFGFIQDADSQESVFVHINSLTEAIGENDKVIFEVEMGHKGLNAINVKLNKG